jgi:CBS domain-containing protein
MATLGEVMSRDVISIEPFDTIGHAAEKMVAEGVSAIVVSDGGRPSEISRAPSRAEFTPARPGYGNG